VIRDGGRDKLEDIVGAIESAGGLEYTARLAQSEANEALGALSGLPETPYRDALASLARFAVARKH
jgi:octaprenyl-diphosphate synthase